MDDLFDEVTPKSAPPELQIFGVTELTRAIRASLETDFHGIWVSGEISNYRRQASGHQYFTLKDDRCQLPCVLFARPYQRLRQVPLSEGMQVQVRGDLTVYEARGQYQLNVNLVQPAGAGLLAAKFEALKRKLEAEGLFDSARKRALPKFPGCIGIVTSPSGAAIRDMLNILHRRAPWVRILINSARVQGLGAAVEVAAALREFNEAHGFPRPDVVVICRGGGSAEDLWEFNEESLARAVFESSIPVISAVGHEIDFTICDFVADLRAPTPSAAAELVVPDTQELLARLRQNGQSLRRQLESELERLRARLLILSRNMLFREPGRALREDWQRLDQLGEHARRAMTEQLDYARRRLTQLATIVRERRPARMLGQNRERAAVLAERFTRGASRALQERRRRIDRLKGLLNVLAPDATLQRGFSITTTADGQIVSSIQTVAPGNKLITRVQDGSIHSLVSEKSASHPPARGA